MTIIPKISTDDEKTILVNQLLADEYLIRILQSVIFSAKSAKEISLECDVPQPTVYRKLKWLEHHKLLKLSGIIDNFGRRYRIFGKTKAMEQLDREYFRN